MPEYVSKIGLTILYFVVSKSVRTCTQLLLTVCLQHVIHQQQIMVNNTVTSPQGLLTASQQTFTSLKRQSCILTDNGRRLLRNAGTYINQLQKIIVIIFNVGKRNFSSLQNIKTRSCGPLTLLFKRYQGLFPQRMELLDHKVDSSPISSMKVKNLLYYPSIPPMLTGIHCCNFTFYLFQQQEIKSHIFPCNFTGNVTLRICTNLVAALRSKGGSWGQECLFLSTESINKEHIKNVYLK